MFLFKNENCEYTNDLNYRAFELLLLHTYNMNWHQMWGTAVVECLCQQVCGVDCVHSTRLPTEKILLKDIVGNSTLCYIYIAKKTVAETIVMHASHDSQLTSEVIKHSCCA